MFKKAFVLIAVIFCCATLTYAQDIVDVILVEQVSNHEQGPRSPSQIPISCYVISNTTYLSFSSDLGYVDVTLEEATEGVLLQTSVDTSNLSAILPFSGAAGEYVITFTLPSGVEYVGEFIL